MRFAVFMGCLFTLEPQAFMHSSWPRLTKLVHQYRHPRLSHCLQTDHLHSNHHVIMSKAKDQPTMALNRSPPPLLKIEGGQTKTSTFLLARLHQEAPGCELCSWTKKNKNKNKTHTLLQNRPWQSSLGHYLQTTAPTWNAPRNHEKN